MRITSFRSVATLAAFVAAATAATAQPPNPVKWTIQKVPATAGAGQTVTIELAAQIEKGWHLYAIHQPSDRPIPMKVSVGPASQFKLDANKVTEPEPEKVKDENFGLETHQHSGNVVFRLPVIIAANVAPGQREVEVSARFQACSDKVCLRPTTVTQKATITITAAKKAPY